jgi:hypothetical protein
LFLHLTTSVLSTSCTQLLFKQQSLARLKIYFVSSCKLGPVPLSTRNSRCKGIRLLLTDISKSSLSPFLLEQSAETELTVSSFPRRIYRDRAYSIAFRVRQISWCISNLARVLSYFENFLIYFHSIAYLDIKDRSGSLCFIEMLILTMFRGIITNRCVWRYYFCDGTLQFLFPLLVHRH